MAFVRDQQIPRCVRGDPLPASIGFWPGPRGLQKLLKHVGHSQVVHRRDDPGKRLPRIRVNPHAAAKLEGRVGVDDLKTEVEFPPKLHPPLPLSASNRLTRGIDSARITGSNW